MKNEVGAGVDWKSCKGNENWSEGVALGNSIDRTCGLWDREIVHRVCVDIHAFAS